MLNLSTKEKSDLVKNLKEFEKEANKFQGECIDFLKKLTPNVDLYVDDFIEEVNYIDTIEAVCEQLIKTI